jgi:hypothetical protein
MEKNLSKICWGKMKINEKNFFPFPSKGLQAWNVSRATKH